MNCHRLQQSIVFTVTAGFLLMVIRSVIERAPKITIGVGFGFFVLMLTSGLLLTFLKRPWVTGLYKASCIVLCMLFYPVYFIIYGGMAGGMIPFFLIGFYVISKTFYKTTRIILQSLTGILYTATLLLSHYWWNQGVKMESEASVSAHIWHLTVTGVMLIVMSAVHANYINKEQVLLDGLGAANDVPVFSLPEDIEHKLSHVRADNPAVLVCFTVMNCDNLKQKAGFHGYDAVMNRLHEFFLNLSEPGQTVVSYGGDSFVILLESVEAAFAKEYADALIDEVRELSFAKDNSENHLLGVSVKLKSCLHIMVPGESLEDALKQVEQELF